MRASAGVAAAAVASLRKIRRERFMTNSSSTADDSSSLCLYPRGTDHLAPAFGLGDDDFAVFRRRQRRRHAAELGELRLDLGIAQAGIDGGVELVDDLRRRRFRRADAVPQIGFVAGYKFADRRNVRQNLRALRRGDAERAQLAGPDELGGA